MSKENKNKKIIAITFLVIAVFLIILSFQKTQNNSSLVVDSNYQNINEAVDTETEEKQEESEKNEILQKEVENNKQTDTVEKEDFENYKSFELIIEDEKITHSFLTEKTLYQVMLEMKEDQKINFESREFSGLGSYVYSINNISEDRSKGLYWIYYINDKEANIGVSNYILKDGDKIKWQLEANTY